MSDEEILDQAIPESQPQAPVQLTMTQEQLNNVIKSRVARERERWEAGNAPVMPQGASGVSMDSVKQMMQAEMAKLRDEAERSAQEGARKSMAQKIISDFQRKMEQGKAKYEDFDDVVGKSRLITNAKIVQLATQVDNTDDVMYELARKKGKVGSILALYNDDPSMAMEAMVELSESIKHNHKSVKSGKTSEPLSQIKSSSTSSDDGTPSIRDYMKQDWLRK